MENERCYWIAMAVIVLVAVQLVVNMIVFARLDHLENRQRQGSNTAPLWFRQSVLPVTLR